MNKEEAKRILRQKLIEQRPEMATVFAMQDLKEAMDVGSKSTLESLKIENMLEKLKTKGDDGYTPIKGVDYEDGYTPVKGKDYFDGHTPTDGELLELIRPIVSQTQPKDGHTPTDGELLSLIRPLIPEVRDGETPTDERLLSLIRPLVKEIPIDTPEQIAEKLNTLKEAVEYSVLKGTPTIKDFIAQMKALPEKDRLSFTDLRNWNQPAKGKQDMRWHGGWSASQTDSLYYPLVANPSKYIIGDGIAKITVGLSAPVAPVIGDMWVDCN